MIEVRTIKSLIKYLKVLIKEAYNFENREALKYKTINPKYRLFKFLIIALLFSSVTIILSPNEKDTLYNIFDFLINFYAITIGFTITALVFLAGTFIDFKNSQLKNYEENVKIKICKQLSSTFILSILINVSIVMIGFINNNILINIKININEYIIMLFNLVIFILVYSTLFISLILFIRSINFLKIYIDLIIESEI